MIPEIWEREIGRPVLEKVARKISRDTGHTVSVKFVEKNDDKNSFVAKFECLIDRETEEESRKESEKVDRAIQAELAKIGLGHATESSIQKLSPFEDQDEI